MLGKTNIMALAEGGTATEIEDYRWIRMQSGTYDNFVKAVCKGGYLVAITAGGTVVYTADGETWNAVTLEYHNCRLNDIDWDGSQFVLAGSYEEEGAQIPLCLTTEHFTDFVKRDFPESTRYKYIYRECCCVFPEGGNCVLVARHDQGIEAVVTDFTAEGTKEETVSSANASVSPGIKDVKIEAAKNTGGALLFIYSSSSSVRTGIFKRIEGSFKITVSPSVNASNTISVFECKDILYFLYLQSSQNYGLNKVTDSNEALSMCTGQNFMFVDGAYFDECQLFINSHEMLVVKKGESIADKTVDDLIEIVPEATMTCITKAFGQLFIFGNQGLILRSSVETGNEEGIAVQTLSAKKALAEAKAYADARYAELAARIEALEG